jgi:hypothetical protein
VLFKLFFAKEYPTNKTLNIGNKLLKKKIICFKKLSKFEQYFKLVSRVVKLKILTRKTTDKNNMEAAQTFQ